MNNNLDSKLQRTMEQAPARLSKASLKALNSTAEKAPSTRPAAINRPATTQFLNTIAHEQDEVGEALARSINRVNQSLSQASHSPDSEQAPVDSQAKSMAVYTRLAGKLIDRDQGLQEKVAHNLSEPTRPVKTREAAHSLQQAMAQLPERLQEGTSSGKELAKFMVQNLVQLANTKNMGAGLERDLAMRQINVPHHPVNARQQQASSKVLAASINYIKQNQPEVLAKVSTQEPPQQATATSPQPASTTNHERHAVTSAEIEGKTYLDIFKQRSAQSAQQAQSFHPQGRGVPYDEMSAEISQRIHELITKAASNAKSGNLIKLSPEEAANFDRTVSAARERAQGLDPNNTRLQSMLDSGTSTQQPSKVGQGPDGVLPPEHKANTEPVRGLSLSELSARAAKLQQQFRDERQRIVSEGKLPNPAQLPETTFAAPKVPTEPSHSERQQALNHVESNTRELRAALAQAKAALAARIAQGATNTIEQDGTTQPTKAESATKSESVATKPEPALSKADAKPAEAKPTEAKPAEVKPADTKHTEAKPADAKLADAKPTDAKPTAAETTTKPTADLAKAETPVKSEAPAKPEVAAKPAPETASKALDLSLLKNTSLNVSYQAVQSTLYGDLDVIPGMTIPVSHFGDLQNEVITPNDKAIEVLKAQARVLAAQQQAQANSNLTELVSSAPKQQASTPAQPQVITPQPPAPEATAQPTQSTQPAQTTNQAAQPAPQVVTSGPQQAAAQVAEQAQAAAQQTPAQPAQTGTQSAQPAPQVVTTGPQQAAAQVAEQAQAAAQQAPAQTQPAPTGTQSAQSAPHVVTSGPQQAAAEIAAQAQATAQQTQAQAAAQQAPAQTQPAPTGTQSAQSTPQVVTSGPQQAAAQVAAQAQPAPTGTQSAQSAPQVVTSGPQQAAAEIAAQAQAAAQQAQTQPAQTGTQSAQSAPQVVTSGPQQAAAEIVAQAQAAAQQAQAQTQPAQTGTQPAQTAPQVVSSGPQQAAAEIAAQAQAAAQQAQAQTQPATTGTQSAQQATQVVTSGPQQAAAEIAAQAHAAAQQAQTQAQPASTGTQSAQQAPQVVTSGPQQAAAEVAAQAQAAAQQAQAQAQPAQTGTQSAQAAPQVVTSGPQQAAAEIAAQAQAAAQQAQAQTQPVQTGTQPAQTAPQVVTSGPQQAAAEIAAQAQAAAQQAQAQAQPAQAGTQSAQAAPQVVTSGPQQAAAEIATQAQAAAQQAQAQAQPAQTGSQSAQAAPQVVTSGPQQAAAEIAAQAQAAAQQAQAQAQPAQTGTQSAQAAPQVVTSGPQQAAAEVAAQAQAAAQQAQAQAQPAQTGTQSAQAAPQVVTSGPQQAAAQVAEQAQAAAQQAQAQAQPAQTGTQSAQAAPQVVTSGPQQAAAEITAQAQAAAAERAPQVPDGPDTIITRTPVAEPEVVPSREPVVSPEPRSVGARYARLYGQMQTGNYDEAQIKHPTSDPLRDKASDAKLRADQSVVLSTLSKLEQLVAQQQQEAAGKTPAEHLSARLNAGVTASQSSVGADFDYAAVPDSGILRDNRQSSGAATNATFNEESAKIAAATERARAFSVDAKPSEVPDEIASHASATDVKQTKEFLAAQAQEYRVAQDLAQEKEQAQQAAAKFIAEQEAEQEQLERKAAELALEQDRAEEQNEQALTALQEAQEAATAAVAQNAQAANTAQNSGTGAPSLLASQGSSILNPSASDKAGTASDFNRLYREAMQSEAQLRAQQRDAIDQTAKEHNAKIAGETLTLSKQRTLEAQAVGSSQVNTVGDTNIRATGTTIASATTNLTDAKLGATLTTPATTTPAAQSPSTAAHGTPAQATQGTASGTPTQAASTTPQATPTTAQSTQAAPAAAQNTSPVSAGAQAVAQSAVNSTPQTGTTAVNEAVGPNALKVGATGSVSATGATGAMGATGAGAAPGAMGTVNVGSATPMGLDEDSLQDEIIRNVMRTVPSDDLDEFNLRAGQPLSGVIADTDLTAGPNVSAMPQEIAPSFSALAQDPAPSTVVPNDHTVGAANIRAGQNAPIPEQSVVPSYEAPQEGGLLRRLASLFGRGSQSAENSPEIAQGQTASVAASALGNLKDTTADKSEMLHSLEQGRQEALRQNSLDQLFSRLNQAATNSQLPESMQQQARKLLAALENPVNDLHTVSSWLNFVTGPLSPSSSLALALHQWAFMLLCIRFEQIGRSVDKFLKKQGKGNALGDNLAELEPAMRQAKDIAKGLDGSKSELTGGHHTSAQLLDDTLGQIERLQQQTQLTPPNQVLPRYIPLPPFYHGGKEGSLSAQHHTDEDGGKSWHLNFHFDLEHMGALEVKVKLRFPEVQISFVAERLDTLQRVQSLMPELNQHLAQMGLQSKGSNARLGHISPAAPAPSANSFRYEGATFTTNA